MPSTRVISQGGPLPIVQNVTVAGAAQLLLASGSGYSSTAGVGIGMEVLIDATVVGRSRIFANQAGMHLAFVPVFIPLALAPGSSPFAVTLRPIAGTNTDWQDLFEVTLVE